MIGEKNTFPVQLTISQMESINDLIECNIFDVIRNDVEIDSIEWLKNICAVHETFKNRIEEIMDENYHKEEKPVEKTEIFPTTDKEQKEKLGGGIRAISQTKEN